MEKEKKKDLIKRISNGFVVFSLLVNIGVIIVLGFTMYGLLETCDFPYRYTPLNNSILVPDHEVSNITDCSNMTAVQASACLNHLFKEIFTYNGSNDYDYKNFSQVDGYIRQYGGDCHESATWFTLAAKDLGHNYEYVSVTTSYNNNTDPIVRNIHAFALIADKYAYCILDQGYKLDCSEFQVNDAEDENFQIVIS